MTPKDDPETNKEHALALLAAGYGRELQEASYRLTAPLCWANPGVASPAFNNGSIFFLDCGHGPFAVTADHVYAGYLRRKQEEPGLVCQIERLAFQPEERLIDRDERLDVATFHITESEIERTTKWLHQPERWPPSPPEQGRGVFFTGFARSTREQDDTSVTFGGVSLLLTATVLGEDTIKCQFDRESFVDMGSGIPPMNLALDGVSGAPLWTLVDKPIVGWRLAGVIVEYTPPFEILVARRADCIRGDGHLVRTLT
jgi:hypothetical protein